jgi:PAS domain S-box-containing protein
VSLHYPWSLRADLGRVIGIALAIVLALGVVAAFAIRRGDSAIDVSMAQVARTTVRIDMLSRVHGSLRDAESQQRAYLLTGEKQFLAPYEAAIAALPGQLARFEKISAGAEEAASARKLREEIEREVALLNGVMQQGGTGARFETSAFLAAEKMMGEVRTLIEGIRETTVRELRAQVAERRAIFSRSRNLLYGTLAARLLVAFGVVWFIARHFARRWRAERRVIELEAQLRATLENIDQGVCVFDSETRVVAWNRRFLELRGTPAQRMRPGLTLTELRAMSSVFHVEEAGAGVRELFGESHEPQQEGTEEVIRDDGVVLQVRSKQLPTGLTVVTYHDITALRNAVRGRQEQASRLTAILNNIQDAIIMLGPTGLIEDLSAGAERLFDCASQQLMGRSLRDVIADAHVDTYDRMLSEFRSRPALRVAGIQQRLVARRLDGIVFPAEFEMVEVWIGDRPVSIAVMRDITERERVERMKDEFVATVSHELRTPLTSIVGALGLLDGGAGGKFSEAGATLIGAANRNASHLLQLIGDLLDLQGLESGNLQFVLAPHPVYPIVARAVEAHRAYAESRNVRIELEECDPAAAIARVDAMRFQQVVANLLSNAAKFSSSGSTVRVRVFEEERSAIVVSVRDEGIGIAPEFRPRMFARFAQADSSDSGRGGTGLGLSIAKTFMNRMAGTIDYESSVGAGTTFYLRLKGVAA